MQSVELIVNDVSLDLDGKTKISIVLQAQDLGDISEKVGSFSRSFTIPVTEKNRRALENSYTFSATTNFAYRKHRAVLKVNGIELPEGLVIIENNGLSADTIRLTFYTGNSPLFQTIKTTKLRSLPYRSAYHNRFTDLIAFSRGGTTTDWFYPLIAYNNDINDITQTSTMRINCNNLLPALRLPYVMSEIANAIGYTFTGNVLNELSFTNAIFPFSGNKFIRDNYPENRCTFHTKYLQTQPLLQAGVSISNFSNLRLTESHPTYNYAVDVLGNAVPISVNPNFPTIRNAIYATDNVQVKVKFVFKWTNTISAPVYVQPFLPNGGTCITIEQLPSGTGAVYNGSNTTFGTGLNGNNVLPVSPLGYVTTWEGVLNYTAHNVYYLQVYSNQDWSVSEVDYQQEFLNDNGTTESEKEVLLDNGSTYLNNVIYDTPSVSRSFVSPSMCLPNITIGDFLKTIANIYGCIIFIDDANRTVEFFKFEQITANIPYAIDWSKKLVNLNEHSWNTRPSKYAQRNLWQWENVDPMGANFKEQLVTIDDNTLTIESVIVKIPFSGSLNVTRLNGEEIAFIQRLDDDGLFIGDEDKQRMLLVDSLRVASGNKEYYRIFNGVEYTILNESSNAIAVGYFSRVAGMPLNAPQLSWLDYMWQRFYLSISQITNNYKELDVLMLLNAVDVQTLDFRKPIYLQQYNSYFYIQKISDWTGEKPVKVELLKLN